ncbi:Rne/Rng family ribonuclease [Candidatus Dependentiae bacterium]|nr:Rne/Rng family ribonuclease [Candidatus Dependentiae bacterium]
MKKQILINNFFNETRVAILEDSNLVELNIERESAKHIYGNIYKGRVVNILPAMQAAFINIGLEKNAFLHVSDASHSLNYYKDLFQFTENGNNDTPNYYTQHSIEDLLKRGQELLVQVKKETISDKGAKVTTNITLPGGVVVYLPTFNHVGISKRIVDNKQRQRLKKMISHVKKNQEGFIIRTRSQNTKKQELLREINFLRNLWGKIKKRNEHLPAPALIYEDPGMIYRVVRDLITPDTFKVWIDDKEKFYKLQTFIKDFFPKLKNRIQLYNNPVPLFQYFKIEGQIEEVLKNKVKMKSGAELVFEQTESMTTIDINSGRFSKATNFEMFALKINMEAAKEIPKQLRLRDIGGIIIIDFIDMSRTENKKKVVKTLQVEFKKDKTFTKVYSFSPLGLVEMIRTRRKESLLKNLYTTCPTCNGEGDIPSSQTMTLKILRKLKTICISSRDKNIMVKLNPFTLKLIEKEDELKPELSILEDKYKKSISLIAGDEVSFGEILVVSYKHIV